MNADPRILELLSQPAVVDGGPASDAEPESALDEPVTQTRVSTDSPGSDARDAADTTDASDAPAPRRSNRPSRPSPARRSGLGGLATFALRADDGRAGRIMELVDAMSRTIKTRPGAAIAASIGIGFLVGGALTFRAGRLLLATGARHVARGFMKQML